MRPFPQRLAPFLETVVTVVSSLDTLYLVIEATLRNEGVDAKRAQLGFSGAPEVMDGERWQAFQVRPQFHHRLIEGVFVDVRQHPVLGFSCGQQVLTAAAEPDQFA